MNTTDTKQFDTPTANWSFATLMNETRARRGAVILGYLVLCAAIAWLASLPAVALLMEPLGDDPNKWVAPVVTLAWVVGNSPALYMIFLSLRTYYKNGQRFEFRQEIVTVVSPMLFLYLVAEGATAPPAPTLEERVTETLKSYRVPRTGVVDKDFEVAIAEMLPNIGDQVLVQIFQSAFAEIETLSTDGIDAAELDRVKTLLQGLIAEVSKGERINSTAIAQQTALLLRTDLEVLRTELTSLTRPYALVLSVPAVQATAGQTQPEQVFVPAFRFDYADARTDLDGMLLDGPEGGVSPTSDHEVRLERLLKEFAPCAIDRQSPVRLEFVGFASSSRFRNRSEPDSNDLNGLVANQRAARLADRARKISALPAVLGGSSNVPTFEFLTMEHAGYSGMATERFFNDQPAGAPSPNAAEALNRSVYVNVVSAGLCTVRPL